VEGKRKLEPGGRGVRGLGKVSEEKIGRGPHFEDVVWGDLQRRK